ncbi:MAG: hypothetical protein R6V86_12245 [Spirochaetia bacterium]
MKVTIIYDNTAFRADLKSNWGFAALVEAHGRRILFDTGTRPESLTGLQLICATHCTRHKKAIQRLYPEVYVEGGAGRILEIGATVSAQ